jgi:hypothetical protein
MATIVEILKVINVLAPAGTLFVTIAGGIWIVLTYVSRKKMYT